MAATPENGMEKLDITPWFDMELFLSLSQETRMDGDMMNRCMGLWKEWSKSLHACRLSAGERQYLLVWLDDVVEDELDAAWDNAPADGFFLNTLAQTLCMSTVHDVLPEVQDAGCAPAPKVTPELAEALRNAGVPYQNAGPTLSRRFAVVTPYPFGGGCEVCTLKDDCPKHKSGVSSVVLPGFDSSQ